MKLLVFEGINGSGKTSTITALKELLAEEGESRPYPYTYIDRLLHSFYVFEKLYCRIHSRLEYAPFYIALKVIPTVVIFLDIEEEIAYRRIGERGGDAYKQSLAILEKERALYSQAFKYYRGIKVMRVEVDWKTPRQIAEEIHLRISNGY